MRRILWSMLIAVNVAFLWDLAFNDAKATIAIIYDVSGFIVTILGY